MRAVVEVVFERVDELRPPPPGYYLARYFDERRDVSAVVAAEWDGRRWVPWAPSEPKGKVTAYARFPLGRLADA